MNEKPPTIQFMEKNIAWVIPVAISILTAMGYALAYFFEVGFCNQCGIPTNLIQVRLSNVLSCAFRLIIVLGLTWLIWYAFLFNQIKRAPDKLRSTLYLIGGLFFPLIIYIITYLDMWKEWISQLIAVLAVAIIFISYELIAKYIFRRKTSGVVEKKGNIGNTLTIKKVVFIALSIVFILFWTSHFIGQADAKKQDKFLTISIPQYSAVLRIYGDNIICQPLDKSVDSENQTVKYTLKGNIFVVRLSNTMEHVLNLENTGRLIK